MDPDKQQRFFLFGCIPWCMPRAAGAPPAAPRVVAPRVAAHNDAGAKQAPSGAETPAAHTAATAAHQNSTAGPSIASPLPIPAPQQPEGAAAHLLRSTSHQSSTTSSSVGNDRQQQQHQHPETDISLAAWQESASPPWQSAVPGSSAPPSVQTTNTPSSSSTPLQQETDCTPSKPADRALHAEAPPAGPHTHTTNILVLHDKGQWEEHRFDPLPPPVRQPPQPPLHRPEPPKAHSKDPSDPQQQARAPDLEQSDQDDAPAQARGPLPGLPRCWPIPGSRARRRSFTFGASEAAPRSLVARELKLQPLPPPLPPSPQAGAAGAALRSFLMQAPAAAAAARDIPGAAAAGAAAAYQAAAHQAASTSENPGMHMPPASPKRAFGSFLFPEAAHSGDPAAGAAAHSAAAAAGAAGDGGVTAGLGVAGDGSFFFGAGGGSLPPFPGVLRSSATAPASPVVLGQFNPRYGVCMLSSTRAGALPGRCCSCLWFSALRASAAS